MKRFERNGTVGGNEMAQLTNERGGNREITDRCDLA
jgi:hypothetical protein